MANLREALMKSEAQKRGTPKEFMDRKYLKSSEVKSAFVCDANPIIINKPKYTKQANGEYERAENKHGDLLFMDVVWLPIELNGTKCVVCTIQKDVAEIVRSLGDPKSELLSGTDMADENRVVKLTFPDKFEGDLIFETTRVRYADGKYYDNYVLAQAE